MKKFYSLLLLGGLITNANGQSGTSDLSFGTKGVQTTGIPVNVLSEAAIKVLPAASATYVVSQVNSAVVVAKYLPNGTIDTSYGTKGYSVPVSDVGVDAVVQNDGKVVVVTASMIIRYTASGALDNTFSEDGLQTVPASSIGLRAVTAQGSKLVVAGSQTLAGNTDFALLRYNNDGSLDTSFSGDGLQTTDFGNGATDNVQALTTQGDKVVAAGFSNGQLALARYNPDGSPDTSFSQDGRLTYDNPSFMAAPSVASQGDKIVVAGSVEGDFAAVRYNNDGSLDTSFSGDGLQTTDMGGATFSESAQVVTIQGDKIVLTGRANTALAVVRYTNDGSLDTSFSGDGKQTTTFDGADFFRPASAFLQGDKLVVAGFTYTFNVGGNEDIALVRYTSDGSLDNTFSDDGKLTDFFPFARTFFTSSVVQTDGKVVAAGYTFMSFPGFSGDVFVAVRYNTDGSLDKTFSNDGIQTTDFGPGSVSAANAVMLQGNKIVLAGYSYNSDDNNNMNVAVVRYNADGTLDNSFSEDGKQLTDLGPSSNDFGQAVISQDDKIVVTGYSYNFETGIGFTTVRYKADGSLDNTFSGDGIQTTSFGEGSSANAYVLALQGDKLLVAGNNYNPQTGNLEFAIVRYNADGSLDTSFGETGAVTTDFGMGSAVFARYIRVQSDRIFVAGYQSNPTQVVMARYTLNGTLDTGFGQGGKRTSPFPYDAAYLTTIAGLEDGKFVAGGNITSMTTNNQTFVLARYNADGSLDTGFNGNSSTGDTGSAYYLQAISAKGNRLYGVGYRQVALFDAFGFGSVSEGAVAAYKLEASSSIACPASKTVVADAGICGAVVQGIDPAGASSLTKFILSGVTTTTGVGSASGKTFATGVTVGMYVQASEPTKTCSFTVTVLDQQAPSITGVSVSKTTLWPPNHKMVDITLNYNILDNCQANPVVSVASNEPQTGPDDTTPDDWQVVDAHHLKLRAERTGGGNGRVYTITITATDASGNKAVQTAQVTVPHNNSGRVGADELSLPEGVELLDGLAVKAMPNPTQTYFTLLTQRAAGSVLTMQVTDLQGRIKQALTSLPADGTFQFGSEYAPGTYILTVMDGSRKITVKLLKQGL